MANIIDIGNCKTLHELACTSLYTDHILVHAYSYYCYVCTNTMHLLFSFCTPSCWATFISEWEMGPINFSEFPPPLTLYILNCIMNCGLCSAMYNFHLVLCYDMICFFVVSINIYLTWLDLKKKAKPFPEPKLLCCQQNPFEQTSVIFL